MNQKTDVDVRGKDGEIFSLLTSKPLTELTEKEFKDAGDWLTRQAGKIPLEGIAVYASLIKKFDTELARRKTEQAQ